TRLQVLLVFLQGGARRLRLLVPGSVLMDDQGLPRRGAGGLRRRQRSELLQVVTQAPDRLLQRRLEPSGLAQRAFVPGRLVQGSTQGGADLREAALLLLDPRHPRLRMQEERLRLAQRGLARAARGELMGTRELLLQAGLLLPYRQQRVEG